MNAVKINRISYALGLDIKAIDATRTIIKGDYTEVYDTMLDYTIALCITMTEICSSECDHAHIEAERLTDMKEDINGK